MSNWKNQEINVEVFENTKEEFVFIYQGNDEIINFHSSCDCMTTYFKDNILTVLVEFKPIPLNKKEVDSTKMIIANLKGDNGVYFDILKINCKIKK